VRIVIILIVGILSYLFVFLPGYFFFLPEESRIFNGKNLHIPDTNKKSKELPLKNPGKEPTPK